MILSRDNLCDLGLSARSYNILRTFTDPSIVLQMTGRELRRKKNCGDVSVAEIAATLDAEGIYNKIKTDWSNEQKRLYFAMFERDRMKESRNWL